jgi:hypothetical protein
MVLSKLYLDRHLSSSEGQLRLNARAADSYSDVPLVKLRHALGLLVSYAATAGRRR